ncbi:MAG: hypothetical protein KAR20_27035, partial [Candidatus Heimdallarchaeota archaeon]|nr:hypothetical protein [Candidatus Heimdallarchaeota archaeon]
MTQFGYRHYAGLKGSKIKTVGSDADIYQYTDLETCLSESQANDVIYIDDGTYSLTATNTINYNLTIIGRGNVIINGGTAGIADRLFMINKPASGTAVTTVTFENLQITNAYAAADVFEIDSDGGGSSDLVCKFIDCGMSANAGMAIDLDQTTNTVSEYIYVVGNRFRPFDSCNFALSKAASEVHVSGYLLDNAEVFALGTADVASLYFWDNVIFSSAAFTSGGAASIIENATNCAKIASG